MKCFVWEEFGFVYVPKPSALGAEPNILLLHKLSSLLLTQADL